MKSNNELLKSRFNTYLLPGAGFLAGLVFFVAGAFFPDLLVNGLQKLNVEVLRYFGSFYLWIGLGVVLLSLVLVLLPVGRQRLGSERPQYSYFSWVALLYSTGMGSGLLLRAVQEPIYYLQHPPVNAYSPQLLSLQYTYFHWGFTPWAMYSVFGLIIAFYLYAQPQANFLEALKASVGSPKGISLVILLILLITVVGVVASLGLGASQFLGGMVAFFHVSTGTWLLAGVILLLGITATASALTGIHRVIKWLADLDMVVSLMLMFFVACFANFPALINQTGLSLFHYLRHFVPMSLAMGDFNPGETFTREWTVFYWAFWLAWVPFTGLFIARISKGRTLREFLIATILVPALATIVWFSVFGHVVFALVTTPQDDRFNNVFTSLFVFLQQLPFSTVSIPVSIGLLLTALINSVDSAIFVLSMFSDGGKENPSGKHKLLWGVVITATTLGMALAAGSELLTAVSHLLILMALPFSFLYVYLIFRFAVKLYKSSASSDSK